jgi:hypothetical protein
LHLHRLNSASEQYTAVRIAASDFADQDGVKTPLLSHKTLIINVLASPSPDTASFRDVALGGHLCHAERHRIHIGLPQKSNALPKSFLTPDMRVQFPSPAPLIINALLEGKHSRRATIIEPRFAKAVGRPRQSRRLAAGEQKRDKSFPSQSSSMSNRSPLARWDEDGT